MLGRPLVRRHRLAARAALYGGPTLVVVTLLLAARWASEMGIEVSWRHVDWESYEEVRLLRDYVRIDTTNPDGNEIPGAEFLARHLEEMGLDVHLERLGPRNANLWAVLEGDERQALVLHHHIDTDPVDDLENWPLAGPFSGAVSPPYLVGRGAFDMKSTGIAQLLAVKDLAGAERRPARSVLYLATGDEEVGSWLGIRRLLATRPELVARFWAALTEGGAVEAISTSEIRYWGTEFAQRRYVEVAICHPDEEPLVALRSSLVERQSRNVLSPEARAFFAAYAPSREHPDYRRALTNPDALDADAAALTPYTRAMIRSQFVLDSVAPSPEGGFRTEGWLALAPGVELPEALGELAPEGFAGFAVTFEEPHPPIGASSVEHPVFRTVAALIADRYPEVPHGPLLLPWTATDSRFLRAAGIPSWGFSPFRLVASDSHKLGGAGERITLPEFVEGVALYRELVRRIASGDVAGTPFAAE